MKDLMDIVPDAIKAYPGLFVKVYARCGLASKDNGFDIDPVHNRFEANISWNCTLFRTGGYALFRFYPNISYTTVVNQRNSLLIHNISSAYLSGIEYEKLEFNIES